MGKVFTAIGLMSGTSMDGIDLALIRTDGEAVVERERLDVFAREYSTSERKVIEKAIEEAASLSDRHARPGWLATAENMITQKHSDFVLNILRLIDSRDDLWPAPFKIDLIGFHGQTVLHNPEAGLTIQLGDGQQLADKTGIPVVADLRVDDIKAGGQGAPLVPVYHQALVQAAGLELPVAIVNVGGVANVTYVGAQGELIAFDTGPGNALINDWVSRHGVGDMDINGRIAARGKVKESMLSQLLADDYFSQGAPKSLDRNHFSLAALEGMSLEWGAATLTSFTALAVARADFFFPQPPTLWVICGGGARNPSLMQEFDKRLSGKVVQAEKLGWSSDYMEAEAFAYLAVRAKRGLPITFPTTTGAPQPMSGGSIYTPGE